MSPTKKTNKKSVVLAFYPHPKAVGFAIMDSPTSVKESGCWYISAKDVEAYLRHITTIVKYYKPTLVILESDKSRRQYRLKHMLFVFKEIEQEITQMNYCIAHYSRKDIQKHFGQISKQDIASEIAERFPGYIDRVPRPRVSTDGAESPRMSEFDSLSLCITHFAQN